jgi:hypothetical protein
VRIDPRLPIVTTLLIALATGCGGTPTPADVPGQDAAADPALREFNGKISDLISDATERFRPLDYGYDEDLLKMLDQVDRHLTAKVPGPPPRFMPKLDADEEVAHFRETVRRWTAKSGKNLRAEVDKLQAMVDARKPRGKPFDPEFHRRFAETFDDLIPIEVAEIRERRNRLIHEKARLLFDASREKYPAAVRESEALISKPPYALPTPEPAKSGP